MPADLTSNPFASTHSLDANPFDDPDPAPAPAAPSRVDQLSERERDLERREAELNAKTEHIRTHGRNNWPFCTTLLLYLGRLCAALTLAVTSLPSYISQHSRRDTRALAPTYYTAVPTMACPLRHTDLQYGCVHIPAGCGGERWWFGSWRKHRVCGLSMMNGC